jgi:DNA-binding CsgD family transcriptional regulator
VLIVRSTLLDHYAKRAGIDRHANFTHGPQRDEDAVDAGTDASTIGPIQLIAVGFEPGVGFVGTIIEEIDRLQGHGVLRLVDLVVLTMDEDGSLTRVEIADEDFGDLLIADAQLDPAGVFAMFEGRGVHVLQSERAQALAESLVPGSGLALILVEHRWARSLFDSIADLGGVVFSEGFIGERAEELVSAQLAVLEDTARVIDAAYAAQTDAERGSAAAIDAAHQKADDAAVAASISAVELEVLRYLPTKMTFALVADKLGISRSAAKERAERAYKKLGVHNRADAVARARELGLIRHTA